MSYLFNTFSTQTSYILRTVWQDLCKRKLSTLLTVLVISISLTIPMVGYLLWKNTQQAVTNFYPEQELTVYLHKNLSKTDINSVVQKIYHFEKEKIQKVEFISREQSLADFRAWSGFGDALDILDDNPLPAIVIVKPKEPFSKMSILKTFRESLQNIPGVQEVRLDSSWLEKLKVLTWLMARIGIICAVLMSVSVFLIISNTIRIDVSNNKDTIKVMQLVGATEYFIARRFIYTGILYGVLGSLLALCFAMIISSYVTGLVKYVADLFVVNFQVNQFNFSEIFFIIIFCTFIGWVSAKLATNRCIYKLGTEKRS